MHKSGRPDTGILKLKAAQLELKVGQKLLVENESFQKGEHSKSLDCASSHLGHAGPPRPAFGLSVTTLFRTLTPARERWKTLSVEHAMRKFRKC